MPSTPKKAKATEARTAQTGMYEELDLVDSKYITPKQKGRDEEYSPVKSVEASSPTEDEIGVAARQEEFQKRIMKGKSRRHKRKLSKKTRKVKKTHRK